MTGKCKICNNLKNDWCEKVIDSPDPDIVRECRYFSHMTNADRFRATSDEELADALMAFLVKSVENGESSEAKVKVEFEEGYRDALLEELRQPVEDGDNDVD